MPTEISFTTSGYTQTTATSKTTAGVDYQTGDLIIAVASHESNIVPWIAGNLTNSGGLSFTHHGVDPVGVLPAQSGISVWSVVAPSGATGVTFTIANPRGTTNHGYGVSIRVVRSHGGVGALSLTNNGDTVNSAPQITISATGANSLGIFAANDWQASTTARTSLNVNVAYSEETYQNVVGVHTVYGGYYTDMGAAGSKTLGFSAPTDCRWAGAAIEVLATQSIQFSTTVPKLRTRRPAIFSPGLGR